MKFYRYGATYHASIMTLSDSGKKYGLIPKLIKVNTNVCKFKNKKEIKRNVYSLITILDYLIGFVVPWWGSEVCIMFQKKVDIK